MAKPKVVPKGKVPFRIFEAGPGIVPFGIIRKAAKSQAKGKNREFVGVDKNLAPKWLSLLFSRRLWMPSNLKLKRANAVSELSQTKSRSHDIVFESYLLNNLDEKTRAKFFSQAKRVLKPGGRLFLVQDTSELIRVKDDTRKLNWSTKVFGIPDKALKTAPSLSIRARSTKGKRLQMIKNYMKRKGSTTRQNIEELLQAGVISSPEEYAKPVIIVLQKPRKEKRARQPVKRKRKRRKTTT